MIALPRNPKPMDKAGEKALYRQLILATPEDSYLRTVLMDSESFVFGNIDNDIAWPVYERSRILDREIDAAKATLKDLGAKIATARKNLESAEREVRIAKHDHARILRETSEFLDKIDESKQILRRSLSSV